MPLRQTSLVFGWEARQLRLEEANLQSAAERAEDAQTASRKKGRGEHSQPADRDDGASAQLSLDGAGERKPPSTVASKDRLKPSSGMDKT